MHYRSSTGPAATTAALLAGALACISAPAQAALKVGDAAPAVHSIGALAGETFDFDLTAALAQGPVVIYFFPKAFTRGCTIEAKAQYCSDKQYRPRPMLQMQRLASVAHSVIAHFALDPARVPAPPAAHATGAGNLLQQRITPVRQTLRGEWPRLAASCA